MSEIRSEVPLLVVFDEAHVDLGVEALLALKDAGEAGDKRYDVIGKTVNTAAALEGRGVALSVSAFRKLGPALRRRFKKHTPPITYIRLEDRRT
jgi:class 3 adenylate cyclase